MKKFQKSTGCTTEARHFRGETGPPDGKKRGKNLKTPKVCKVISNMFETVGWGHQRNYRYIQEHISVYIYIIYIFMYTLNIPPCYKIWHLYAIFVAIFRVQSNSRSVILKVRIERCKFGPTIDRSKDLKHLKNCQISPEFEAFGQIYISSNFRRNRKMMIYLPFYLYILPP